MYTLKSKAEDFVVEEISSVKPGSGNFALFELTKTNYSHYRAIAALAKAWHVHTKDFGYAGLKDKKAVTTQVCSVRGVKKELIERTELKDISVKYLGQTDSPVGLKQLKGNRFTIVLRDVTSMPKWKNPMINYFGEQRFSTDNAKVGKLLVQKKYAEAVPLLRQTKQIEEVDKYLEEHPNDYIRALLTLPKTLLSLYVKAYQSLLWNEVVKQYVVDNAASDVSIPLIGFGTEDDSMYEEILLREGITLRDFINKSLPMLSLEGDERKVWVEAKDFEFSGNEVITVSFSLPPGCYATEFIAQAFQ